MKKVMLAALAIIAVNIPAWAYEIQANPDRRISIGLNYDHQHTAGDYEFAGGKIDDFNKLSANSFLADVKIPVSGFCTLQVRGGYVNANSDLFTGEEVNSDGYDVGAGVRFYLP